MSDTCPHCCHPVEDHKFSLTWRGWVCHHGKCRCARYDPEPVGGERFVPEERT